MNKTRKTDNKKKKYKKRIHIREMTIENSCVLHRQERVHLLPAQYMYILHICSRSTATAFYKYKSVVEQRKPISTITAGLVCRLSLLLPGLPNVRWMHLALGVCTEGMWMFCSFSVDIQYRTQRDAIKAWLNLSDARVRGLNGLSLWGNREVDQIYG